MSSVICELLCIAFVPVMHGGVCNLFVVYVFSPEEGEQPGKAVCGQAACGQMAHGRVARKIWWHQVTTKSMGWGRWK